MIASSPSASAAARGPLRFRSLRLLSTIAFVLSFVLALLAAAVLVAAWTTTTSGRRPPPRVLFGPKPSSSPSSWSAPSRRGVRRPATTTTTTTMIVASSGRIRRRRRRRRRPHRTTTASPFVVAAAAAAAGRGEERRSALRSAPSSEDASTAAAGRSTFDAAEEDESGEGAGGRRRRVPKGKEDDDDVDVDGGGGAVGRSDDDRRKRRSESSRRSGRRRRRPRRPPSASDDDEGTPTRRRRRPTPAFDEKWDRRYEELVEYRRVHGDCLVPQGYEDNPALGRWVRNQRVEYRYLQKGLPSYISRRNRIGRLEDLKFVWNGNDVKWNQRFEELVAFQAEHGHLNVPSNDDGSGRYKRLASWIRCQRMCDTYVRRGDPRGSNLTTERRSKLESIGFVFDKKESLWMDKFERLKRFREVHGHCNVPSDYEDGALARWVLSQRVRCKAYLAERDERRRKRGRRGRSESSESEAASSDDDDEEDDSPEEDEASASPATNEKRRQTRVRFRRASKPAPSSSSPQSSSSSGIATTPGRYELLKSIDFAFDPNDDYWWEQYSSLKSYQSEHGPSTYPTSAGSKLGNWVSNQRRLCRSYVDAVTGVSSSPTSTSSEEDDEEGRGAKTTTTTAAVSIPGLNEERIEALRDIDFCWLPDPDSVVVGAPREASAATSSIRDAAPSIADVVDAAVPSSSTEAEATEEEEEESKEFSWDDVWDEL